MGHITFLAIEHPKNTGMSDSSVLSFSFLATDQGLNVQFHNLSNLFLFYGL